MESLLRARFNQCLMHKFVVCCKSECGHDFFVHVILECAVLCLERLSMVWR